MSNYLPVDLSITPHLEGFSVLINLDAPFLADVVPDFVAKMATKTDKWMLTGNFVGSRYPDDVSFDKEESELVNLFNVPDVEVFRSTSFKLEARKAVGHGRLLWPVIVSAVMEKVPPGLVDVTAKSLNFPMFSIPVSYDDLVVSAFAYNTLGCVKIIIDKLRSDLSPSIATVIASVMLDRSDYNVKHHPLISDLYIEEKSSQFRARYMANYVRNKSMKKTAGGSVYVTSLCLVDKDNKPVFVPNNFFKNMPVADQRKYILAGFKVKSYVGSKGQQVNRIPIAVDTSGAGFLESVLIYGLTMSAYPKYVDDTATFSYIAATRLMLLSSGCTFSGLKPVNTVSTPLPVIDVAHATILSNISLDDKLGPALLICGKRDTLGIKNVAGASNLCSFFRTMYGTPFRNAPNGILAIGLIASSSIAFAGAGNREVLQMFANMCYREEFIKDMLDLGYAFSAKLQHIEALNISMETEIACITDLEFSMLTFVKSMSRNALEKLKQSFVVLLKTVRFKNTLYAISDTSTPLLRFPVNVPVTASMSPEVMLAFSTYSTHKIHDFVLDTYFCCSKEITKTDQHVTFSDIILDMVASTVLEMKSAYYTSSDAIDEAIGVEKDKLDSAQMALLVGLE
eukprot:TRINITY_DN5915_c0_g1_i1.p1 TRINITY_DN5915_c0_g1~~TRINITY_DN5915_c0_g1_i1.p1  ORF type:complete len:624 (-),score=39.43 TRINITY_DN5915_c0_g1_i1:480-2351(-)